MEKALDFLDIQKQALTAASQKSLEFIILNQTLKLVPYKQAIFWMKTMSGIELHGASGNASVDEKGPYALWLKKKIQKYLPADNQSVSLSLGNCTEEEKEEWQKYCTDHALLLPLSDKGGDVLGGVWFERDAVFKETELALLEELKVVWQAALALFVLKQRQHLFAWSVHFKNKKKWLWAALLVVALFPVRQTITAPAEIVARKPMVASVPYDGILKTVLVSPGDTIEEGQALAEMEREKLEAEAKTALQELETARASLERLSREALGMPEKKTDINLLRSQIQSRQIDYDFAQDMLEKSTIKSPKSGIVIFSDVNEWQGKPVVTGESIMEVAAPSDIELLIRVPVESLMPFAADAPARFYPNVRPLEKIKADVKTIGYQASVDPDGLLTYKIRASIADTKDMRIGWKGTAKISGGWTVLSYTILRRPLIALRKLGGG